MNRHVILIGMTAAGKSVTGQKLAQLLRCQFVDTDALIEKKAQCSIADIFADKGEPFFRQREQEALQTALAGDACIIATGGGVVLAAENRRLICADGWVVYLQATTEVLLSRLRGDAKRPLLMNDAPAALARMAAEREPLYEKIAHLSVVQTANDTPAIIADKICAGLRCLG